MVAPPEVPRNAQRAQCAAGPGFSPSRLYLILCAGEFSQEIFASRCSLNGMLVRE
jgi:hypothetical protein